MEEKVSEKVEKILNQFVQEELGNRLSQFAMLALKQAVMNEVVKLEQKDKE
jgi:hypothetical protein